MTYAQTVTHSTFYSTGNAWNEIVPGLWQGGSDHCPDDRFDIVYTFGHEEFNSKVKGDVHEVKRQLLDAESSRVTHPWDEIRAFAIDIARQVEHGHKVLVRCNAGWNRSGVVVARAMMEMGYPVTDAISMIREKRHRRALSNYSFVDWLHEEAA